MVRSGQAQKRQEFRAVPESAVPESSGVKPKGKRAACRPPLLQHPHVGFLRHIGPYPPRAGRHIGRRAVLDVEAALLQLLRVCRTLRVLLIHDLAVEEMH